MSLPSKIAALAAAGLPLIAAGQEREPADPSFAQLAETGRYLADAAHCAACHTSRADRPYAGNLAITSSFGTLYSSNITPDPATGIGNWTEAQFAAALRDGKGRHGEPLYPAMPYENFTKIGDADVHALWTYFRSLPAIAQKQRPNAMKFPFNVRSGLLAWQAAFFRPGRYVPDASQPDEWNRGAYLVQGLGHCGACHTPRNLAMAEKKGASLQGGAVDNWFAPDISGGRFSGIAGWSVEQVAAYLKTGHNGTNVAAVGPMMETIAQGTSKLAVADLHAIAVYLKNQAPVADAGAKAASGWNAERRASGQALYEMHCAACHRGDGQGTDGIAPALAGNTAVTSKGPETVVHSVLQGYAPMGRWGAMPSFDETLDAQQVADVANYARIAWGGGDSLANATPSLVNRMRFAGVSAAPGVQAALVCPPVPADRLDAASLADVDRLAKAGAVDPGAASRLMRGYRVRHADVDEANAINALSGAYCRNVMASASGTTVEKQQRYIEFTARLASAGVLNR